jgi:hypothetical protein
MRVAAVVNGWIAARSPITTLLPFIYAGRVVIVKSSISWSDDHDALAKALVESD